MKTKRSTKFLSLFLVLCFLISPSLAMASSTGHLNADNFQIMEASNDDGVKLKEIPHTKEMIVNELYKIGFTDEEIEELFKEFPYDENVPLLQLDPTVSNYEVSSALKANTLISLANTPGKTKPETYYISTSWVKGLGHSVSVGSAGLGLSSSAWSKILVQKIGWRVTAFVGVVASALADMFMGPNGVRLDVIYTWAYGDSSMVWYWAPTKYTLYRY